LGNIKDQYKTDDDYRGIIANQRLQDREREFKDREHARKLQDAEERDQRTKKLKSETEEIQAQIELEQLKERLFAVRSANTNQQVRVLQPTPINCAGSDINLDIMILPVYICERK
jgi:DNA-binding transcriptional regulator GbsR (MarR family)